MAMTKVVNGKHIDMTPEEEQAHLDSHPILPPDPPTLTETQVLQRALQMKGIDVTDADLEAAILAAERAFRQ